LYLYIKRFFRRKNILKRMFKNMYVKSFGVLEHFVERVTQPFRLCSYLLIINYLINNSQPKRLHYTKTFQEPFFLNVIQLFFLLYGLMF